MNSDYKVIAAFKLVRPLNILIIFLTVIIAAVINTREFYPITIILLTALTASLTAAAGNVINDIVDIEGDRINHPTRPLPRGIISKSKAISIYIILVLLSEFISFYISPTHLLINSLAAFLLLAYSLYLKRVVLAGNLVISFLTGLVFVYGGLAVNELNRSIIPALFAFLINLIRELVKDMEDKEGDIKDGIISFPVKYGFRETKRILTFLSVILIVFTFYPYLTGTYGTLYLTAILLTVNPLLVYFSWKINTDPNTLSLHKLSFLLKLNMIFGLFAVYLGK